MTQHPDNYGPPADVVALRRQLAECEAHLADLRGDLERLRTYCQTNLRAAKVRYAQTGDADWLFKLSIHEGYWEHLKPVE